MLIYPKLDETLFIAGTQVKFGTHMGWGVIIEVTQPQIKVRMEDNTTFIFWRKSRQQLRNAEMHFSFLHEVCPLIKGGVEDVELTPWNVLVARGVNVDGITLYSMVDVIKVTPTEITATVGKTTTYFTRSTGLECGDAEHKWQLIGRHL